MCRSCDEFNATKFCQAMSHICQTTGRGLPCPYSMILRF
jgi:hypothetical protein